MARRAGRPRAGDPAPDFSCRAADGSLLRLSDFRGRKLVLYFYPMDDTPGCTAQACSLRDVNRDIAAKGAAILGVSAQDEDSHRKFASKHKLNFPLLADTDRRMAKAYGVAGSGLFGVARALTGMNERVTFIIDGQGKIAHVLDDPNCRNHGEEVLKLL